MSKLFDRLYGGRIIRNDLRGELVEEIVGVALAAEWRLCGSDWGSCDLQHNTSGQRIQVKQSAAQQTWVTGKRGYSPARFSIATKSGGYDGADWVDRAGRNADIFIFAWHDVTGADCDHADPGQWQFFVVVETALPAQKSIGLKQLQRLATAVDFAGLCVAVRAKLDNDLAGNEDLASATTV